MIKENENTKEFISTNLLLQLEDLSSLLNTSKEKMLEEAITQYINKKKNELDLLKTHSSSLRIRK